ncbi:MAG: hypothetical protein FWF59_07665 [Turicibacter sp.]|nr:hypothetical protein [Turicibacter sp.]
MALTHKNIKLTGVEFLHTLNDIEITQLPNEHGKLVLRGFGNPSTLETIQGSNFGKEVTLSADDNIIFAGTILEIKTEAVSNVDEVTITVVTATHLLDGELKSRSFQDHGGFMKGIFW